MAAALGVSQGIRGEGSRLLPWDPQSAELRQEVKVRQIRAGCQGEVFNVRFFHLKGVTQDAVSDPCLCRNSRAGCSHRAPDLREVLDLKGFELEYAKP